MRKPRKKTPSNYDLLSVTQYAKLQMRIRVLHQKGLTSKQIAKESGETLKFVRRVLKNLALKENVPVEKKPHCWAKKERTNV